VSMPWLDGSASHRYESASSNSARSWASMANPRDSQPTCATKCCAPIRTVN
jgi:hypothetical protein